MDPLITKYETFRYDHTFRRHIFFGHLNVS
jgi:hypothetical protein